MIWTDFFQGLVLFIGLLAVIIMVCSMSLQLFSVYLMILNCDTRNSNRGLFFESF